MAALSACPLPAAADQALANQALAGKALALRANIWSRPPEGGFTPPGHCPDLARRQTLYRVCDDQRAIFDTAMAQARRDGKLVLVTFGSTWCPSCRSFSTQLEQSAGSMASVTNRFTRVEIAISTLSDGRRVPVPTGEEVLQRVLAATPGATLRGVPFIAVIDPNDATRGFARNLDDAEVASGGAFDIERVAAILAQADAHVRTGASAPDEPGWLRRKLRRWFDI